MRDRGPGTRKRERSGEIFVLHVDDDEAGIAELWRLEVGADQLKKGFGVGHEGLRSDLTNVQPVLDQIVPVSMQEYPNHWLHFCRKQNIVIRPAMNWDDLKVITAVRNKGTFAKAGAELRMDETTVARRLGRIQKTLGITLFDAVDGARKPTPQCEAVLSHIEEMARAANQISMIGSHSTGPVGNIRLTSTPSIAEQILAPGLGQFLLANPGISLELDTSNQNLNFSHWEADLAIRLGKPDKGAFSMRKLADLRFHLFQARDTAKDAEVLVCAYPEELSETPEMKELSASGFPKDRRLKTANVRLIRSIITSYAGVGVLPQHLSADLLQDNLLRATPLKARREVFLLIQPHLKDDPATRLAVDWIVRQFSN